MCGLSEQAELQGCAMWFPKLPLVSKFRFSRKTGSSWWVACTARERSGSRTGADTECGSKTDISFVRDVYNKLRGGVYILSWPRLWLSTVWRWFVFTWSWLSCFANWFSTGGIRNCHFWRCRMLRMAFAKKRVRPVCGDLSLMRLLQTVGGFPVQLVALERNLYYSEDRPCQGLVVSC